MTTPDSHTSRRALILFTSDPVVEARRKHLAGSPEQCRAIYRAFVKHILGHALVAADRMDFDLIIVTDRSDVPNIHRTMNACISVDSGKTGIASPATVMIREHRGTDLGAKLHHALKDAFGQGYEQVVVIGNDCLDVTPELLEQAFSALEEQDAVIGPAQDGGFYLLGLTGYAAELFEGVRWCTASVLGRIRENLFRQNRRHAELPLLKDIDTPADLLRWLQSSQARRQRCLCMILLSILCLHRIALHYRPLFSRKIQCHRRRWQLPPPSLMD